MDAVMRRVDRSGEAAASEVETEMDVLEALIEACDDAANLSTAEERSAAYRKGYSAALRYARICVLDQMASAAMDFTDASHNGDHRPERHRARTLAALRTISQRLSDALHTNPEDDVAAGYRDGILIALDLTEEQERAVQRELSCATLTG
ncbi:hypothetical protein ABQF17_17640 [Mycolicibacterium elephantis]|nr:hypothetical protein [Mycolicibacterium elephantis]